jgi:adenosylcobyric acid synthase
VSEPTAESCFEGHAPRRGTHSDAGKSVVAAGICRWLAREGVKVAPFKAQNMALNSFVTREGAEIGRAQAAQAAASRVEPEAAMNPVLLKPSAERRTQVIVRGKPYATASARSYQGMKGELLPVVLEALEDLRRRFEVVVCEGRGARRRSTCARTTSLTWASRARRSCPWWSSGT